MSRTIVLVHGAWVTPDSWDTLRRPFEAAGFTVHAPAWPMIEGRTAAELNARPPSGFGALTLGRIADSYQAFIDGLPEKPVLLGHSFGGLLVQLLLDRGLREAGIAIDPAPIGGIVPGPSALAAIAPILLRLAGWRRPHAMSRERFGRLFANAAPPALVDEAFRTFVIPAPGMIFHQAALWIGTRVDPRRRSQPLLITGGGKDWLVSPYLARAAYRRQRKAPGRTDYVEFPDRSHLLIGEPGWEEIAGTVLDWIGEANVRRPARTSAARLLRPAVTI